MSKRANDPDDDEPELIGIAHTHSHGFGKSDPRYQAMKPFMPSYAVFFWPPAFAGWVGRCAVLSPSADEKSVGLPPHWPNLWRMWARRLVQAQQPETSVQLVASKRHGPQRRRSALEWSLLIKP